MQLQNTRELIARVEQHLAKHGEPISPSLTDIERHIAAILKAQQQWSPERFKDLEDKVCTDSWDKPKTAVVKRPCNFCRQLVTVNVREGREYFNVRTKGGGVLCPGGGLEVLDPVKAEMNRIRTTLEAKQKIAEEQEKARKIVLTCAADIEPEPTWWLWKDGKDGADGRLPLGQLALLAGREGEGKSSIAYERAARITRGQLEGDLYGTPRAVIIAATEDSWKHTIVPRLMVAGADLKLVFRIQVEIRDCGTFDLILPEDVQALKEAIVEKEAALVLLDPVISRISKKLDTHKDADVRGGLEPMARLADETSCCVLGIIHVNKSSSRDPLTTIMGSRAFVATARAVLYVVKDPDDPKKRLLGQPKNNLGKSGDDLPTLVFRIEPAEVPTAKGPANVSRVVWEGTSEVTINEVLNESASGGRAVTSAKDWLAEYMESLPTRSGPSREIKAAAKKAGLTDRTLKRACKALGLAVHRVDFPRRTIWALPGVAVQSVLPGTESGDPEESDDDL
jgi:hypothetical protein